MRLIMMGNGPFAAPTLAALYETSHQVAALVIRPPRSVHGRAAGQANPCQTVAERHGTPVLAPADINAAASREALAAHTAELFVVCDYGQILSRETLGVARLGGVNLHASLLPAYRGAAPINWAIYHGETETGVTVIHMTPRLDGGPAIGVERTPIGHDETAAELEPRLAALGAGLVCRCVELLATGRAEPIEQDNRQATRAPRLQKTDGVVDWSRSAEQIRNQIRAFQPWPKTHTLWSRQGTSGEPLRLILERAGAEPGDNSAAPPGEIIAAEPRRLAVATGAGALVVERLQPAGKRTLTAGEFLNGYPLKVGDRWG